MIVGVLGCMAERLKDKFLEEEKIPELISMKESENARLSEMIEYQNSKEKVRRKIDKAPQRLDVLSTEYNILQTEYNSLASVRDWRSERRQKREISFWSYTAIFVLVMVGWVGLNAYNNTDLWTLLWIRN